MTGVMHGIADRDAASYHDRIVSGLRAALADSAREPDPERAVAFFTAAARASLGDDARLARPGALKDGETHFSSAGVFFVAPCRTHMILCAEQGFGPEQRHARIAINDSRPGHTVASARPALVPDTDIDPIFRQIQANGRAGCSSYAPVIWNGEVIGMFFAACKARRMYDDRDNRAHDLFAAAVAPTWIARGGMERIAQLAERLGPWSPS